MSSFKGFLYSPIHGVKVAWAAHSVAASGGVNVIMTFPYVYVNVGNAWQTSTNQSAVIPVAGTYYVVIGATQQPNSGAQMSLYKNGIQTCLSWLKNSLTTNAVVSREAAFMLQLKVGDTLAASVTSGYYQGFSSFEGFLLYLAV